MASFDPQERFDPLGPPPRPTTPPVRRTFLIVLGVLSLMLLVVYGVPYAVQRAGYAWEAGRSRAAADILRELDREQIINEASALFRIASTKVAPAVVNIQNLKTHRIRPGRGGPLGGAILPVESGSGFVIDKERGYVVTNHHVVEGAGRLIVRLGRNLELPAQLVGSDPKTDLAVLKVPGPLKVAAEWGDSDKLDVGDWVLAIGSPLNLDQTVTAGIVSATGRSHLGIIGEGAYEDFVQTDAALNPGNSGGPLIDLRGNVVGVNTAIVTQSGGNQGIGLAISSELARRVVGDLIEHGRVARGYLGVALEDVNAEAARALGLPEPSGAHILEVEPESPAARAGLKRGDVVVRIGEHPVEDVTALRLATAEAVSGTTLPLTIYRGGRRQTLAVTIGELPLLMAMGAQVHSITPEIRRIAPELPDHGVVVTFVEVGSPADRAGLRPLMPIVGVGDRRINDRAELSRAIDALDPQQGIPLRILGPGGRHHQLVIGGPRPGEPR